MTAGNPCSDFRGGVLLASCLEWDLYQFLATLKALILGMFYLWGFLSTLKSFYLKFWVIERIQRQLQVLCLVMPLQGERSGGLHRALEWYQWPVVFRDACLICIRHTYTWSGIHMDKTISKNLIIS